jgi:Protein of unknown function (DUF2934)
MINSSASKQSKSTTVVDPKRFPEKTTTMPNAVCSEEMIRARAYDLYESRGREPGQDEQDWLRAEQEINGARGTEARSAGGYSRKLEG